MHRGISLLRDVSLTEGFSHSYSLRLEIPFPRNLDGVEADPAIGVYEWQGKQLEAWVADRRWHVRYNGREVDAPTVDQALESAFAATPETPGEAMRLRLAVQILLSLREH